MIDQIIRGITVLETSIHLFFRANRMLGRTTKSIVVVIRMDNLIISNITIQSFTQAICVFFAVKMAGITRALSPFSSDIDTAFIHFLKFPINLVTIYNAANLCINNNNSNNRLYYCLYFIQTVFVPDCLLSEQKTKWRTVAAYSCDLPLCGNCFLHVPRL